MYIHKYCSAMLLSTIVWAIAAAQSHAQTVTADYYVAPNGSDTNNGSITQPFATVARAQQAVRGVIAGGLNRNLLVYVRGGTYYLNDQLSFDTRDSGTTQYSVTYQAYPGETPIFSGGRPITNWQNQGGDIWTATIPEVKAGQWWFRQLFADGVRCERARWPNRNPGTSWPSTETSTTLTSVGGNYQQYTLADTPPVANFAGKDTELVIQYNWNFSRTIIQSSNGSAIQTASSCGPVGLGELTPSPGRYAYLEHAREFIDQPTEWYLERSTGVLTYQAPPGVNPNNQLMIAPKLNRLMVAAGTSSTPIRNLNFKGLVFQYTNWDLPSFGYNGVQASHYVVTWPPMPTYVLPLAVELTYANGCLFDGCTVAHVGATAIGFGAGCVNSQITNCTINDAGATGIMIGYRANRNTNLVGGQTGYLDSDWATSSDIPQDSVVSNNVVTRCGVVDFGAVGIYEAFCQRSQITHNLIADLPYGGISIGFTWGPNLTNERDVLVAYNYVHHVLQVLNDSGAIYTLGNIPGAVMRGNVLCDVFPGNEKLGAWLNNGVFFDNATNGWLVDGNVVYNTPPRGDWGGQGFETYFRFNPERNDNMVMQGATSPTQPGTNILGIKPGTQNYPLAAALFAGPTSTSPTIRVLTSWTSGLTTHVKQSHALANAAFLVANAGTGNISYTMSTDVPWMNLVGSTSGTSSAGTANTHYVAFDVAELPIGTHKGYIRIESNDAKNPVERVNFTVTVDPPHIVINPQKLQRNVMQTHSLPNDSFTVTDALNYSVSSDVSWLSVSPVTASSLNGVPVTHTIAYDVGALDVGTYTANVTIDCPGADNSPVVLPVTVVVNPPHIAVSPASWIRYARRTGSLPNDRFTVSDTLDYSISTNVGWLSVLPTTGNAGYYATKQHDVSYSIADLNLGLYKGAIAVTSPGADNSPKNIDVTLVIEIIPGDMDNDLDVDQSDFGLLQRCLSENTSVLPYCGSADFNKDSTVDMGDINIFLNCYTGPNEQVRWDCDAPKNLE